MCGFCGTTFDKLKTQLPCKERELVAMSDDKVRTIQDSGDRLLYNSDDGDNSMPAGLEKDVPRFPMLVHVSLPLGAALLDDIKCT